MKLKIRPYDIAVIAIIAVITGLSLISLRDIRINGSIDVFLPEEDELTVTNDILEAEFGTTDPMLLSMEVEFGSILTLRTLQELEAIVDELEDNSLIDEVLALVNADYIQASQEGLKVVPLVGDLNDTTDLDSIRARILDWRETYIGTFISSDFKIATIIIRDKSNLTPDQKRLVYEFVRGIKERHVDPLWNLYLTGRSVLMEEVAKKILKDFVVLVPVTVIIIIFFLFLAFRRIEGIIFPFLTLTVASLWVLGVMSLLGLEFTMISFLTPILILVVGSAYTIHFLSHFFHALSQRQDYVGADEIAEILKKTTGNIRVSILMAGLTTAVGFIALLTSPSGEFKIFGLLCAFGVAVALLVVFLLMPPIIRIRFRKGFDPGKLKLLNSKNGRFSFLSGAVRIVTERKSLALSITILIVLSAVFSINRLETGMRLVESFDQDSSIVHAFDVINERMNGTGSISILIEAPERGAILEVPFLAQADQFAAYMKRNCAAVTNVQSLCPLIRRMNKIMNFDSIPYAEPVQAAEDIDLFSDLGGGIFDAEYSEADSNAAAGSSFESEMNNRPDEVEYDAVASVTVGEGFPAYLTYEEIAALFTEALAGSDSPDPSATEIVAALKRLNNFNGEAFNEIPLEPAKYGLATEEDLQDLIAQYLVLYSGNLDFILDDDLEPRKMQIIVQLNDESNATLAETDRLISHYWKSHLPESWSFLVGGSSPIVFRFGNLIMQSQIRSIVGALLLVWIIITVLLRSPAAGTVGIIPILLALCGIFSIMVFTGLKLNAVTAITAALAIGIGADYAIHMLTAYRRSAALSISEDERLTAIYNTTGRAIVFNMLSVAGGFLGFVFSDFAMIRHFGLLFAASMILSGVASLILIPIVLDMIKPSFLKKRSSKYEPS